MGNSLRNGFVCRWLGWVLLRAMCKGAQVPSNGSPVSYPIRRRLIWFSWALFVGFSYNPTPAAPADPIANASIASDGLLYAAVKQADKWWAAQGEHADCPAVVYTYDESDNTSVLARGDVGGCNVYFERKYVARIRTAISDSFWFARRAAYYHICFVATHERGHNIGYEHSDAYKRPIMGLRGRINTCRSWAKRLAPSVSENTLDRFVRIREH